MYKIRNFIDGKFTTILGLSVLTYLFYMITTNAKFTLEGCLPFALPIIHFFFTKTDKGDSNQQATPTNTGTNLVLVLLIPLLFSCEVFKKTPKISKIDTLQVIKETIIQKDSVNMIFRHDTLRTFERIIERQGRATIIYQKDSVITRILAKCDSIVIKDTIKVPYEKIIYKEAKESEFKQFLKGLDFFDFVRFILFGLAIIVLIYVAKKLLWKKE